MCIKKYIKYFEIILLFSRFEIIRGRAQKIKFYQNTQNEEKRDGVQRIKMDGRRVNT